MDITFNIGGAAGQGIDTIGDLLTQVFVQAGFYTFTIKDFESRIRGGYNFTQIRVSDKPIYASVDEVDVIIALSKDAVVGKDHKTVSWINAYVYPYETRREKACQEIAAYELPLGRYTFGQEPCPAQGSAGRFQVR